MVGHGCIHFTFVSKFYIPLYEKLREDGRVQDDLDAILSTFPIKIIDRRDQLLYTHLSSTSVDICRHYRAKHGAAAIRGTIYRKTGSEN